MSKVLNCGTKIVVAIENTEAYSMDGVKNGDKGEIVGNYFTSNCHRGEYWAHITREDGTICEDFMIDREDFEVD